MKFRGVTIGNPRALADSLQFRRSLYSLRRHISHCSSGRKPTLRYYSMELIKIATNLYTTSYVCGDIEGPFVRTNNCRSCFALMLLDHLQMSISMTCPTHCDPGKKSLSLTVRRVDQGKRGPKRALHMESLSPAEPWHCARTYR